MVKLILIIKNTYKELQISKFEKLKLRDELQLI